MFTVYANSVILNKNTVSRVRMIDYGSEARSPQRSRECCLSRAVNTISALYECHQQSNDLLHGRFCLIFFPSLSLFLTFSPVPPLLSCRTKLHIFLKREANTFFVPAWLAFSFDFHFFYWYGESEMWGNEMQCNAKAFLARRYRVSSSWCLEMRDHLYSIHNAHQGPRGVLHAGFF